MIAEEELNRRFETREEAFRQGDWEARILLPRASDELISEAEFVGDERLPYWAELWPAGRALARHLMENPPAERAALELGSGVALPSLALLRMGVAATATDWYADALSFAEVNAVRNGLPPLPTAQLDWLRPAFGAPWPLVLASDVFYEERNSIGLAALLPRIVAPEGRFVFSDPGRMFEKDFRNRMVAQNWRAVELERRDEISDFTTGRTSLVCIWELRPPG